MTSRPIEPSDIPKLKALAERSGYPYPSLDDPHIEAVYVVLDDQGEIVMASAAKRIIELYLWSGDGSPSVKMRALSMLHRDIETALVEKGYYEANIFLPPEIEKSFGRRMMRCFGWRPNWISYVKRASSRAGATKA